MGGFEGLFNRSDVKLQICSAKILDAQDASRNLFDSGEDT